MLLKHDSQVIGQIEEIDPAKFYMLELDSEKIDASQVGYIQQQLTDAGVKAGVIIGSRGGQAVSVNEHPTELGDGPRAEQRMNARVQLSDAHDKALQAGRELVGTHLAVCETLGMNNTKITAAAFQDMLYAIDAAYDATDAQLDDDIKAQQRKEAE